ncbi:MAG TPA: hypothetical protein PLP14_02980, partial [Chitinophagaceae bacterium]|nr:hypothetical protein [Chitinophagaceae bacterium]
MTFTLILALTSCVRERDNDTTMASELAMNEYVYHDASCLADDAASKLTGQNLSNYKTRGYCATLTHDTFNNHIIIDFGPQNCMCNDGRYRRGKVLVDYTLNYSDSGSVHTLTFDEYYVDNHLVMGSNIVENKGHNVLAHTWFKSTVDGKVLKPGFDDTLYYKSNHTI